MRGLSLVTLFVAIAVGCQPVSPHSATVPADPASAQISSTARAAFDQGDFGLAADLYTQLWERSNTRGDRHASIDAAISTAVCLTHTGDDATALKYLAAAEYDASPLHSPRLAEIHFLQAQLARGQNRLTDAAALARSVEKDDSASASLRSRAVALLGQLAVDSRDADSADSRLAEAIKISANPDAVELADFSDLKGQIALLRHNPQSAVEAFEREAEFASAAGDTDRYAHALASAAASLAQTGQPDLAADRYYHAALSCMARRRFSLARRWLDAARSLAGKAQLQSLIDWQISQLPPEQPTTRAVP